MNVFRMVARARPVRSVPLLRKPPIASFRAPSSSRWYSTEKLSDSGSERGPPPEDATKDSAQQSETSETPAETEEQKIIKAKDTEILDLTSRLRYMAADFQNLQQRSEREKAQTREYAITRFAKDLLETLDVLSLALKSIPPELRHNSDENPRLVELYKGVELTEKQLLHTLAQHGVTPYDPLGEPFNANSHEALYTAPAPEGKAPGVVIDVQKIGYTIGDRTLRAPQVGVAADAP